jgi:hypothetical protein
MIKLKKLITESNHMDTSYTVGPSNINGKGVIAVKMIPAGCKALAHVHSRDFNTYAYSDLGYFINHSETPNCDIVSNNNRRYIRTLQDIQPDDELTCNYWMGPNDLERPNTFQEPEHDETGLRKSSGWNIKKVTNVSEPYIKYVLSRH